MSRAFNLLSPQESASRLGILRWGPWSRRAMGRAGAVCGLMILALAWGLEQWLAHQRSLEQALLAEQQTHASLALELPALQAQWQTVQARQRWLKELAVLSQSTSTLLSELARNSSDRVAIHSVRETDAGILVTGQAADQPAVFEFMRGMKLRGPLATSPQLVEIKGQQPDSEHWQFSIRLAPMTRLETAP